MPAFTGSVTAAQGYRTIDVTPNDVVTFTPTSATYTVEYPIGTVAISASTVTQTLTASADATQMRILCVSGSVAYSHVDNNDGTPLTPTESQSVRALVSGAGMLGPTQRAVTIGSSLTDILYVSSALYGPLRRQDRSWLDWARYALRDKNIEVVSTYAVGGNDLDQVIAQAAIAVTRSDADWIIGDTGAINSLCNGTPISLASAITKGQALIDLLASSGKAVCLINPTPIDSGSAGFSPTLANHQKLQAFDAVIGAYATSKGITWVDVADVLVDKTNANGCALSANMQQGSPIDGVHYAQRGARLIGTAVAAAITDRLRANIRLPSSQADAYSATNNPYSLGDNPLMQGTGGTVGAGFTGSVPTGLALSRSGGATGTSSVASRSDGYGVEWSVAFAGAANNDKMFMTLSPQSSSRALPGQSFVGVVQLDVTGMANIKEVAVYVQATVDGSTTYARLWEYNITEAPVIGEANLADITGGVCVTPRLDVPAGASLTDLRMFCMVTAFAASATATVKASRAQLYRVA